MLRITRIVHKTHLHFFLKTKTETKPTFDRGLSSQSLFPPVPIPERPVLLGHDAPQRLPQRRVGGRRPLQQTADQDVNVGGVGVQLGERGPGGGGNLGGGRVPAAGALEAAKSVK